MNVLEFLILLVMAGVLGVVAQQILGTKYGMVVSVIFGIVGAFLGRQLAKWFHFPAYFSITIGDTSVPVLWALIGALLVTFGAGIIAKSNRKAQKKG
jgi:uncharacterized membrane protein YeaQ/YmgE (transglycosylase-associated protein family)